MKRLVILDENMVRVSHQFGEAMVVWYASEPGKVSASRAVSGAWGAELDPVRQGQGKAGEYAVASYLGLNPQTAVKRSFGFADGGADVTYADTMRIDVKTTPEFKRWLIWPKTLNDIYQSKRFDYLVGVSIKEQDWTQCWIDGWISKQDFYDRKLVADGVNDQGKLTPGTWFMEKRELADIETLRAGFVGYDPAGNFVHYCHCGKEAGLGVGVSLLKGKFGTWFCAEHNKN